MKVALTHTDDGRLKLALGESDAVLSIQDADVLHGKLSEALHLLGARSNTLQSRVFAWYLENPKYQCVDVLACLVLEIPLPPTIQGFESNPWDYAALAACFSFVSAVPEVKHYFSALAQYGPLWKAIVNQWDSLSSWSESDPAKAQAAFNRILDLDEASCEDESSEWAAIEREEYSPNHYD